MAGFNMGKNNDYGFEVTDPQKFIKYLNNIIREFRPDLNINDEVIDLRTEDCKNKNTEDFGMIRGNDKNAIPLVLVDGEPVDCTFEDDDYDSELENYDPEDVHEDIAKETNKEEFHDLVEAVTNGCRNAKLEGTPIINLFKVDINNYFSK